MPDFKVQVSIEYDLTMDTEQEAIDLAIQLVKSETASDFDIEVEEHDA